MAQNSQNVRFFLDNYLNVLTDMSDIINSLEGVPGKINTQDGTTFGVDIEKMYPTLKSAPDISFGGFADRGDARISSLLQSYVNGGGISAATPVALDWQVHPFGTTVGGKFLLGTGWLTEFSFSNKPDGLVEFSGTVTGFTMNVSQN